VQVLDPLGGQLLRDDRVHDLFPSAVWSPCGACLGPAWSTSIRQTLLEADKRSAYDRSIPVKFVGGSRGKACARCPSHLGTRPSASQLCPAVAGPQAPEPTEPPCSTLGSAPARQPSKPPRCLTGPLMSEGPVIECHADTHPTSSRFHTEGAGRRLACGPGGRQSTWAGQRLV